MKLIFLIVFSLGFGISGVLSVSPHVWTSAYTMYNNDSEITYYLEKNEIFGSIINPKLEAGTNLRVGQEVEAMVGDIRDGAKDSKVFCSDLGNEAYHDEYKPLIQYYGDSTNAPFGTFIHREVWECESHGKPKIHFYRIVSVMHGIRPVNTIFYFDGIEVIKDTASTSADTPTVTFKEIKYIDPETKKMLIYNGKVILRQEPNLNPMKQFKEVDIFSETYFEDGKNQRREHLGEIAENPETMRISKSPNDGEILRVGKSDFTTLGNENKKDKATCEFQLKERTDKHYLPQCAIWRPTPAPGKYDEFYGVGKVIENYFSVVNQELWKCTYETTEVNGKDSNKIQKTFIRRVTELVGAIPIARIQYFGAVSVWKYQLNSKSYSVRIKEIYYHQEDDINKQIRFNGAVILEKPPEQKKNHRLDKEEDAFFYTYKPKDSSYYPQIISDKSNEPKPAGRRICDKKPFTMGEFFHKMKRFFFM